MKTSNISPKVFVAIYWLSLSLYIFSMVVDYLRIQSIAIVCMIPFLTLATNSKKRSHICIVGFGNCYPECHRNNKTLRRNNYNSSIILWNYPGPNRSSKFIIYSKNKTPKNRNLILGYIFMCLSAVIKAIEIIYFDKNYYFFWNPLLYALGHYYFYLYFTQ